MLEVGNRVVIEGCRNYPYLDGHQGVVVALSGGVATIDFEDWNIAELGHSCGGCVASGNGYYVPKACCKVIAEGTPYLTPQTDHDPDYLRVFEWFNAQQWNPTKSAITTLVDEWRKQKARLIKLFSAHPNYVQDQNKIVFSRDEERTIDSVVASETVLRLLNFLHSAVGYGTDRKYIEQVYDKFRNISSQFLDKETADDLSRTFQLQISAGIKTSKAMNRILSAKGFDKYNDQPVNEQGEVDKQAPTYNKLFAKYADALNPIVVRRFTILSVDILDFLTMSYGTGWKSCHILKSPGESGGWSSGTLSYALDDVSMILYTVDGGFSGEEFWREPKISRQIFCLNEENTLLQSRLYPASGNQTQIDDYRNLVQRTISECLDIPNRWVVRDVVVNDDYGSAIIHPRGATNYPDYAHNSGSAGSYTTYLSRPRDTEYNLITVGSQPICVRCGHRHTTSNSVICDSCISTNRGFSANGLYGNNPVICKGCGEVCFESQACFAEGNYWCADCDEECEIANMIEIGTPYTKWVCPECAFTYAETQAADGAAMPSSQTTVFAQLHHKYNYLGHELLQVYLMDSGSVTQYIVDTDNNKDFLVVNGNVISREDD